jgi:hypothetical protein
MGGGSGGSGSGGRSGGGGGGGGPEPENWYDSPKYQQASNKLFENLHDGKISISDANRVLDAKNEQFYKALQNKKRSPAEQNKVDKLSNEIQAMQHAMLLHTQGAPNVKFNRFNRF